jgi:hypothetical protein
MFREILLHPGDIFLSREVSPDEGAMQRIRCRLSQRLIAVNNCNLVPSTEQLFADGFSDYRENLVDSSSYFLNAQDRGEDFSWFSP